MTQFDLTTGPGRRRAVADYLWKDHAWLRLGFSNAHWISDELVRANQPWPFQFKAWADRGIKTVINLRGGFQTSFRALEVDACRRYGLELVDFVIASRDVPTAEKVLGAHRAGITTIILPKDNEADIEDIPEEVRKQLSFHPVSTLDEAFAIALVPVQNGTVAVAAPTIMEGAEAAVAGV